MEEKIDSGEELTPRQKHVRRLNKEKLKLKQAKSENHVLRTAVQEIFDSRGIAKYRKKIWMKNGNAHSFPISKEEYWAFDQK